MASAAEHMEAEELAARLRRGEVENGTLCVVDVRDSDFEGGHIRGAVNLPSIKLQGSPDALDAFVASLAGKSALVVHCMLSQVRGPASARLIRAALKQCKHPAPRVYILRDGFEGFLYRFAKTEPSLFIGLESDVWPFLDDPK
mmetsp:Transcript_11345/g.30575  ORF Transcript_11345/g.30575 Transcript_11345/m.30575 type:complete len:143 (-) Transcript_11345:35-463(-)